MRSSAARLVYLDLTSLHGLDLSDPAQARRAWDTLHAVATTQGIVNRQQPRLFVRFEPEPDDFWWDDARRAGGWLNGREVDEIDGVEQLLVTFADQLKGVVLYPERPWAWSNVASTIAGVEDRVALRYDKDDVSLWQCLRATGAPCLDDVLDLCQVSADDDCLDKCAVYRWAKSRHLDTGRASPECLAHYIDAYWLTAPQRSTLPNCTLTNHDYFVSKRAFFFDLHVWDDEPPIDDPTQSLGDDLRLLRSILRSTHENAGGKVIHVGGFTPWAWKYSQSPGAGSLHHAVDTEWKLVEELSAWNGCLDADALSLAGMTNASFYQHFPTPDHYPQPVRVREAKRVQDPPRRSGTPEPVYVLHYMGDYDSAAWLNRTLPELWNDPSRGAIDCTWPFNPLLARRAPHAMHYARNRASQRDWFVAGNNGAGYLNPAMLSADARPGGAPDGWRAWSDFCAEAYARFDLSITGFIIEGHTDGMGYEGMSAYAAFSPDGVVFHRRPPASGVHESGLPFVRHTADLDGGPSAAAKQVLHHAESNKTKFLLFRSVLKTPTWHRELVEHVARLDPRQRVRFVTPCAFFKLIESAARTPTPATTS